MSPKMRVRFEKKKPLFFGPQSRFGHKLLGIRVNLAPKMGVRFEKSQPLFFEPQSRFGQKLLGIRVHVSPKNGSEKRVLLIVKFDFVFTWVVFFGGSVPKSFFLVGVFLQ